MNNSTFSPLKDKLRYLVVSVFVLFSLGASAQSYNVTTPYSCITVTGGNHTHSITQAPSPAGAATLVFNYSGDLDGGATGNEYFDLFDENNVLIGRNGATGQCTGYDSITFTIPLATVAGWAADGTIGFNVVGGSGLNLGLGASCVPGVSDNCTYLRLEYPFTQGPNNAAVLSVDSPTSYCPGVENIVATIGNAGNNIINSVIVNWSFNGVVKTPITYTSPLDTVGGLGSPFAQISLGTETFVANTIYDIKVWTSLPNNVADTSNLNDTVNYSSQTSLSGVYTMDALSAASATNFITFTDFSNALSTYGICGPITLNVVSGSGPYVEQVNFNGIGGTSTNTITINGNGETISYAAAGATDRTTFVIQNSSYIFIDSLNVEGTSSTYSVSLLLNNTNNVSYTNSTFTVDTNSTSSNISNVRITGSESSSTTATRFDSLIFSGNTLVGGYYGLSIAGTLGDTINSNALVSNNKIRGFRYYPTYFRYTNGLTFEENEISRPYRTTVSTTYGSYTFGNVNMNFNRNSIHDIFGGVTSTSSTFYGIYSSNDASLGNENYFMNNIMYNISTNSTLYAIYDLGSDYTKFYNNTIVLDDIASTAGLTRGIYNSSSATDLEFQNNIIYITKGGSGAKHGIYLNGGVSGVTSNYNDVYVNSAGSGTQSYGYIGSDKTTLADFQAAGGGANSFEVDPIFTNVALADFTPNNFSLNAAGFPAPQVVEDFNGSPRVITANDIGAFKINSPALDVAANSILINSNLPFCAGSQNVYVIVSNNGIAQLDSVMINYTIDGIAQTPINYQTLIDTIGSTAGNLDSVLLTNYTFLNGVPNDFVVWVSAPNGTTPDAFPPNDTTTITVGPALNGTYTINQNVATSATNFLNFTEFATAINEYGICGPTVINVVAGSGPYTEQVIIDDVPGTSVNTLTINGAGETVTFAATTSAERATFALLNASYVTIDSLNITATGASYGLPLQASNLDHIVIKNSVFTSDTNSTSSFFGGVFFSSSPTSPSGATSIDSLVFDNNTVIGGYYGLALYGNGSDLSTKVTMTNNKIRGFRYYGTYLYYTDGMLFEGNDISRPFRTSLTSSYAMYMFGHINQRVNANAIHNLYDGDPANTGSCYGLYNGSDAPSLSEANYITNNLIYEINHAGSTYALYDGGSDTTFYYNNTIALTDANSSSGTSYGIYHPSASNGTVFKNNIVYITRNTSGTVYGMYYSSPVSESDYNDVYINSPNASQSFGYANSGAQATLADFQALGYDSSSIVADPILVAPFTSSNLLQPLSAALNNVGYNAAQVTTDFNGAVRTPGNMDIGSFEFTPPSVDAGVSSIDIATSFCAGVQPISVTISNSGLDQVDSVMINYTINGVLQTAINYQTLLDTIGSVAGNTAVIPLTTYTFAAGTPATFVVWVSAPNGITPDGFSANDTLALTAGPSLAGNFTVNPNAAASATNFIDLASMSNALSTYGVCDTVNVIVSAGTYTDNMVLENVVGSGPANPIIIDGVDSSTTIVNYAGGGTGLGALSIGNTYNVTVKNFSLNATASSNATGVILANSDYITVSNCAITVDTTVTTSSIIGIMISSNISSNSSGATNRYNTFKSNSIKGGYYGIRAYGGSTQAISNLRLENNEFSVGYYYGLYLYYTDSAYLANNSVDMMNSRASNNAYGTYLGYSTNPIVTANYITTNGYGLYYYMFSDPFPYTRRPMFSNNMIYSADNYGMYIYYADSVDLFHNTIVSLDATQPAVYIYASTTNTATGYDVRNNIFYSATNEALETNTNVPVSSFNKLDYNNYYSAGSTLINIGGTPYSTLAAHVTANSGYDANSIEGDPIFVSLTNLDFHIDSTLVDNMGDNSVGITVDIDGEVRPQLGFTNVDIGADEFGFGPVTNIAVDSLLTLESDCGLNTAEDIEVRLTNGGSTNYTLTSISYVINNGTPVTETITDTIFGGTSYLYTFNTKANFGTAGGYATTIYVTQSPADSIPANDTLSVNIVRSPSTIMDTTATADAFTDFEIDNGDFSAYGANSSWVWGTPSSFYIPSAFSGAKAWVTGLTAGYNANELSYLETQCYDFSGVAATEPVYIQFKNIFKTQIGIDNVWMESSLDNGKTWTKVLASVTAVNWYTNTTTNVWSGFSNGGVGVWIPVVNELLGLGGKSKVKFRFVFESDGTNQNEGFGIDDFRINLTVSAGDDLFNGDALLSIQPNPSNGQFNLIFNNYAKGVYQVAVMNVNGQLVNAENVAVASKFQSKPMNLDNLDKGVYFVKVTNGSSVTTQKLVIK